MKRLKTIDTVKITVKSAILILAMACSAPAIANNGAITLANKSSHAVPAPQNGQNKQNVEAQYGEPDVKVSSVGEPPISKWIYKDFTVYFEYDKVLHAVIH